MSLPRTTIQIIDTKGRGTGHVAQEVRINDIPVLVAKDGVSLSFSDDELTKVTIDLLPEQITFARESHDA